MALAAGVDIVEIARIETKVSRGGAKFVARFCTETELDCVIKNKVQSESSTNAAAAGDDALNDEIDAKIEKRAEYSPDAAAEISWNYEKIAGIYAAKEAFAKAMKTGISQGVNLREIEVNYLATGAPLYKLYGSTLQMFEKRGFTRAELSISHDAGIAVAFCILE